MSNKTFTPFERARLAAQFAAFSHYGKDSDRADIEIALARADELIAMVLETTVVVLIQPFKPAAYVNCLCGFDFGSGLESCGLQPLSAEQYAAQLDRPDKIWLCPKCHGPADYNDVESEHVQAELAQHVTDDTHHAITDQDLRTKFEELRTAIRLGARDNHDHIVMAHAFNALATAVDERVRVNDIQPPFPDVSAAPAPAPAPACIYDDEVGNLDDVPDALDGTFSAQHAESSLDSVDAAVFTGDTFYSEPAMQRLEYYMGRWHREMKRRRVQFAEEAATVVTPPSPAVDTTGEFDDDVPF